METGDWVIGDFFKVVLVLFALILAGCVQEPAGATARSTAAPTLRSPAPEHGAVVPTAGSTIAPETILPPDETPETDSVSLTVTPTQSRRDEILESFSVTPVFQPTVSSGQLTSIGERLLEGSYPFASTEPVDHEEMAFLINPLSNAKVVGIGEAIHGTSEFVAMKDKIFRFLVQEMGYRTLIVEADFAASARVNAFIQTGQENPEEAVRGLGSLSPYNTAEFLDTVLWMRAFNESRPDSQKIHLFGHYSSRNLAFLTEYVVYHFPDYEPVFRENVACVYDVDLSAQVALTRCHSDVNQIISHIRENEAGIEERYPYETQTAIRNLETLQVMVETDPLRSDTDDFFETAIDNLDWIGSTVGKDTGICFWSHNRHISEKNSRVGRYYVDHYGSEYVSIAQTTYSGTTTLAWVYTATGSQVADVVDPTVEYSVEPAQGRLTYEAMLHHSGEPFLVVDIREVLEQELIPQSLWNKAYTLDISYYAGPGVTSGGDRDYALMDISHRFDFLVFIDETTGFTRLVNE